MVRHDMHVSSSSYDQTLKGRPWLHLANRLTMGAWPAPWLLTLLLTLTLRHGPSLHRACAGPWMHGACGATTVSRPSRLRWPCAQADLDGSARAPCLRRAIARGWGGRRRWILPWKRQPGEDVGCGCVQTVPVPRNHAIPRCVLLLRSRGQEDHQQRAPGARHPALHTSQGRRLCETEAPRY
jgi:hypothetical protein